MDFACRDDAVPVAVGLAIKCREEKSGDWTVCRNAFIRTSGCDKIPRRLLQELLYDIGRVHPGTIICGSRGKDRTSKAAIENEEDMFGERIGQRPPYFRH